MVGTSPRHRGEELLIAFEPMTPANALVTGGPELPLVAPGEEHRAVLSISVRVV